MNALTVRALLPRPTDRAVFIGQTGSGKTTLARYLARYRTFFVGIFPKGPLSAHGWAGTLVKSLDALGRLKTLEHPRILYAPNVDELSDPDALDAFFAWVYERENTTLYIDELYAVTRGDIAPPALVACYTRGREKNVETWGATQRPSRVPQIAFTEAEHVYCFRLRAPQDRERVEQLAGIDADAIALLPKYDFFYAPQDGDVAGPLRLNLLARRAA